MHYLRFSKEENVGVHLYGFSLFLLNKNRSKSADLKDKLTWKTSKVNQPYPLYLQQLSMIGSRILLLQLVIRWVITKLKPLRGYFHFPATNNRRRSTSLVGKWYGRGTWKRVLDMSFMAVIINIESDHYFHDCCIGTLTPLHYWTTRWVDRYRTDIFDVRIIFSSLPNVWSIMPSIIMQCYPRTCLQWSTDLWMSVDEFLLVTIWKGLSYVERQHSILKRLLYLSSGRCPKNWSSLKSKCIFVSTFSLNWTDASAYCKSFTAQLLTFTATKTHSMITLSDIDNLVASNTSYFLGLSEQPHDSGLFLRSVCKSLFFYCRSLAMGRWKFDGHIIDEFIL